MGIITHVVAFKYANDVTPAERHWFASKYVALKDTCLAESSQQPYIISLTGGSNISPESFSKGFDHCFIVTFENVKDRDYYLDTDPAHDEFKKSLHGKLEDIFVFDYDMGQF
ncbi:hypothetical protein OIV83_002243 [Microbotryomycetes sp. JL201]|nr:hypothetical protein OIV83_002243 [Microbotryomycetes sp. JL201]